MIDGNLCAAEPLRVLLRNEQSPGDVLMLTAAVRDLHRAFPGRFRTAVQTTCMQLWENNPLVVGEELLGKPDRVLDCAFPELDRANKRPTHFLGAAVDEVASQLGVQIKVSAFRGDIHLSPHEMHSPGPVAQAGHVGVYWVVMAGGKYDYTAKWWDPDFFQAVVDHFAGRIQFVQCGERGHWHPPLKNVIDLVGRTDAREFIRTVYHADGVLCPITFAMHLAAAVPPRPFGPLARPCVVIAGGREPSHWEMYPAHQFLHTVGALDCCAAGGCWKSRCQPVDDGFSGNSTDVCLRPVTVRDRLRIAACMTMITPRKVIDAIETYYEGGVLKYQTPPVSKSIAAQVDEPARLTHSSMPAGVAVTIGVGPYAELARLAARELSARTGLETIVLGDREFAASGLEHPHFLKFRLFDLVHAENILYFDADIVCLAQWEPRPYFASAAIACVRERMIDEVRRESVEWCVPLEEHFNGGMFIVNRSHHGRWLSRAESLRHLHPTCFYDQLPLNAARCELGLALRLLDRRHNWLGFGASSLSHETTVVMAHKLVPGRCDINLSYFKGGYELASPSIEPDELASRWVRGRTFDFVGTDGPPSVLRLRDDGTVTPAADPESVGYWFMSDANGRPTLALASETKVLHRLVQELDGVWLDASKTDRTRLTEQVARPEVKVSEANARQLAHEFVRTADPFPKGRFRGRGIVICGGGEAYFPSAWVCIRMLRRLGCLLPIELWQLWASELGEPHRQLVQPLGIRCVDASEVRQRHPARILNGWELKPYAILNSAFEEVLLLDADNMPVRDPTFMFDASPYRSTGAVFWPDFERLSDDRRIWEICGIPHRDEPEFETGQILVNKRVCWQPLSLTMHLNEHSDFYYNYIHGDKETFHMAWRMLGVDYSMPERGVYGLAAAMCQHDFEGRRLFQHRNLAKWRLRGGNRRVEGFEFEDVCLALVDELASRLAVPRTRGQLRRRLSQW